MRSRNPSRSHWALVKWNRWNPPFLSHLCIYILRCTGSHVWNEKTSRYKWKKKDIFCISCFCAKRAFNTVVHLRALLCVCTCVGRVNHTLRFFTVDISRFQAGGKLSQPQDITSKSAVEPQAGRLVRGNRRVCRSLHHACLHNSVCYADLCRSLWIHGFRVKEVSLRLPR